MTAEYSTALEFTIPQVLDLGRQHDELWGWRYGRFTLAHREFNTYTASWGAFPGDREVIYRGRNVTDACRGLLAELRRRIAAAEQAGDGDVVEIREVTP